MIRLAQVRPIGLALLLGGCVSTSGGPDVSLLSPPAPEAPVLVETGQFETFGPAQFDAPVAATWDPIVHSPWTYEPTLSARVQAWVDIFVERDGAGFALWVARMERYRTYVDSVVQAQGLPASLRYLPIIESGYQPTAISSAAAVGLWQFVAPTAREQGLTVTPLIDERRDPVRSTSSALELLGAFRQQFGSWFLALAAYNGGPNRVERLLREHAPLAPRSDSLFFVIAPHLPRETREYIPRFLAAVHVAEHAARFGLAVPEAPAEYRYDEVVVPDATTLDVVALAAGASEDEVRQLNPHIVRGITPRGRVTQVRVPEGSGPSFAEAYDKIPPEERITATEHVVASGETLSHIARQYGVRVADLEGANPQVEPRRMRVGTRLLVPLVPRAMAQRSRRQ